MNVTEGQYIDIFNYIDNKYVPVRIIEKNNNALKVFILDIKKEKELPINYIKQCGYKIPYISEKLITNAGFERSQKSKVFIKDNLAIIGCFKVKIKKQTHSNYWYDLKSKFFGYKIIETKNINDFGTKLEDLPFETEYEDFVQKYDSFKRIEELFKKLKENGVLNLDEDNLVLISER